MDTITEGSTATYSAVIVDPVTEIPVPKSSVTDIFLTYYDDLTGTIINNRHDQDALDANDCSLATDGTFTWLLQPEDTIIVNTGRTGEWHVALFVFEWSAGRKTHRVKIRIVNYRHEPASEE